MWYSARLLEVGTVAFPGQRIVAFALMAAGLLIDAVSVVAFFRAKTTINPLQPERSEVLVVKGLYRVSRNPMYLGMLLILMGICVYLGQPLNVVFLMVFVGLINTLQIRPEERALRTRFGQSYVDYCHRVRRWV